MSLSKKLVIKHHSPLQIIAIIVISCTVIITTTWIFFDESQWSYIKSSLSEGKKNKELWQENQAMNETITDLQEQIVMLERTAQIEKQTITNLQRDIIKQQDGAYKLKNELEFYREIMASASESVGLNIQGLRVEKTSLPRSYYFRLILTHVSKSDKVATGKLSIMLEGVQDDAPRTVDIKELTLSESLSLVFKFTNFERLEGSIVLPEGFVAHRVIVRVHQTGAKTTPGMERIFDWAEVTEI